MFFCCISFIEENLSALFQRKDEKIIELICQSLSVKKQVVEKDPYDLGRREILNFGHTLGHGFESASHFLLTHGEAVTLGLLGESFLSYRLEKLPLPSFQRIEKLLCHLPLQKGVCFSEKELFSSLFYDKKVREKKLCFVLLEEIGKPFSFSSIPSSLIKEALFYAHRYYQTL